jgi:allophanate hydrolase subunit 2
LVIRTMRGPHDVGISEIERGVTPSIDRVGMGPDHPVTGGYMQPMTVLWSERWKLAHLAPRERVRFIAQ